MNEQGPDPSEFDERRLLNLRQNAMEFIRLMESGERCLHDWRPETIVALVSMIPGLTNALRDAEAAVVEARKAALLESVAIVEGEASARSYDSDDAVTGALLAAALLIRARAEAQGSTP